MKKYIAGFRSDNPKKKKKAIIYYVLVTLFFMIGSSWSLNDLMTLLILLATPSLIYNFKRIKIKSKDSYEHKKIFFKTVIFYIFIIVMFSYTAPDDVKNEIGTEVATQENIDQNNNDKDSVVEENKNEDEQVNEEIKEESNQESDTDSIGKEDSDSTLAKEEDNSALIDDEENEESNIYSNTVVESESTQEPDVNESSETVYWTPKGKSYHTTKSCPTLSRSKVINSGTIDQSGKYDPCDRCH